MSDAYKLKLKDRLFATIVSLLGWLTLSLLGRSWRIEIIGMEKVEQIWRQGKRVCYVLWHGRLLALGYAFRGQGVRILSSQHRDGEVSTRTVKRMGYTVTRGSSTRGGVRAIRELIEASKIHDLALTPDGPKGPVCKVQLGVVYLASRAQIPMIPIASSSQSVWKLASWDSFQVPRPFSRVVVILGDPIQIPNDCDSQELAAISLNLEEELNRITRQADDYFKAGN